MTPFTLEDIPKIAFAPLTPELMSVPGIPQSSAPPAAMLDVLDVRGQPDYRDDHEKAMEVWRHESATAFDEAVIDPESYKDESVPHGFTPDEWRKTRVVDDWMRLHSDGQDPPMDGHLREFTRAQLAERVFGGAGTDSDDALFGEITKAAQGRKESRDFFNELGAESIKSATIGSVGEAGSTFQDWRKEAIKRPGYKPHKAADYYEAWHEKQRRAKERVEPYQDELAQVWRAMKAGGAGSPSTIIKELLPFASVDGNDLVDEIKKKDAGALAFEFYDKLPEGERAGFMDGLAVLMQQFPKKDRPALLATWGKNFGGTVDSMFRGAASRFTADGMQQWIDQEAAKTRGPFAASEEFKAQGKARTDESLKQRNFMDAVREIERDQYTPTQFYSDPSEEVFSLRTLESGFYGSASAVASVATMAIPYVGTPIMALAMEDFAYGDLRDNAIRSGASEIDASRFAHENKTLVAVPQIGIEILQNNLALGRLPAANKVLMKLGDSIKNRLLRGVVKGVAIASAETTVEEIQYLTPYVAQELSHALEADTGISAAVWSNGKNGALDGFWTRQATTFIAMLPLAAGGAVGGLNQEARNAAFARASTTELQAYGGTAEGIAAIKAANGPASLAAAIETFAATRDPNSETAKTAALVREKELEAQRAAIESAKRSGMMPEIKGNARDGYTVLDGETKEEVGTAPDIAGTMRLAGTHSAVLEDQESERIAYISSLLEAGEGTLEMANDPNAETSIEAGTHYTEAVAAAEDPRRIDQWAAQVAIKEKINGGTGQVTESAIGMNVTETRGIIRTFVNRLFQGASVLTAVHETGHGMLTRNWASGAITREETLEYVRKHNAAMPDRKLTKGDWAGYSLKLLNEEDYAAADAATKDKMLHEAIAEILENEVLRNRKRDKGTKAATLTKGVMTRGILAAARYRLSQSNPKLAAKFKALVDAVRGVVGLTSARVLATNKAIREGTLKEADIEAFMDKLTGRDHQAEHDSMVRDEHAAILGQEEFVPDENNPFSLGRVTVTPTANTQAFQGDADSPSVIGPAYFSIAPDYGMNHRPNDDGPRAHDLAEQEMTPADVYEHPEWYSGMSKKVIEETMRQLRAVKGKADALLTIYRAGPVGEMNPGDWVSLSKDYARTHADAQNPEGYKVWEAKVKAQDVRWAMDDLAEFGFFGEKSEATQSDVHFSLSAWHGTPHKVDKFSTDKIGTGEGAQAYGYGLYFAAARAVADSYASALGGVNIDGQPYDTTNPHHLASDAIKRFPTRALAIADFEKLAAGLPDAPISKRFLEAAEILRANKEGKSESAGNLYRATLKVDDEDLLDWDKPLSEQSEMVKAALKGQPEWHSGQMIHGNLAEAEHLEDMAPTERYEPIAKELQRLGIRGIRYLDGNSRNGGLRTYHEELPLGWEYFKTESGWGIKNEKGLIETDVGSTKEQAHRHLFGEKPSYNYVIFDAADIEIVEENGTPVKLGEAAPFSLAPARDSEYLALAKDPEKNREALQKMVDVAAKAAGGRQVLEDDDIDPNEISPRNELDADRLPQVEKQAEIMREKGWVGRPLLIYYGPNGYESLTGSHRLAAASEAELETVPVVVIKEETLEELGEWIEDGNSSFLDLSGFLNARESDQLETLQEAREAGIERLDDAIDLMFIEDESNGQDADMRQFLHKAPWIIGSQIKSADPVTYDASGNIIPLSQRFNPASDSINFSLAPVSMGRSLSKELFTKKEWKSLGDFKNSVYGSHGAETLEERQVKVKKNYTVEFTKAMKRAGIAARVFPPDMPEPVRREILSWDVISKSPYSASFYNSDDKSWDYTRPESLRVADHWNFEDQQGAIHARTDKAVAPESWALARYQGGTYQILDTWAKNSPARAAEAADMQSRETTSGSESRQSLAANEADSETEASAFSLAPSSVVDSLSVNVAARIKDPKARMAMFTRLLGKLGDLKRDRDEVGIAFGKGYKRKAIEDPRGAGIIRKDFGLRKEAAREQLEQTANLLSPEAVRLETARRRAIRTEELEDEAHAKHSGILHNEDLAKLKEQPVHSFLADPNSPLRGRLMSQAVATSRGKNFFDPQKQGDYDGAGSASRSLFGGNLAPDQAAQELFDAGLIKEPTPDAMWDALARESKTVEKMKEFMKAAKADVAAAKVQAKAELETWARNERIKRQELEEAQQTSDAEIAAEMEEKLKEEKANYNPRERLLRAMAMMDAIISVLPIAERGRVGGYTQLAKLGSDEARLKFLNERIEKLDEVMNDYLGKEYRKTLEKIIERSKPKNDGKGGKKRTGKLGHKAHDFFSKVELVMELTDAEVDAATAKLEKQLANKDEKGNDLDPLSEEEQADLFEEWQILNMFGTFDENTLLEKSDAIALAQEVYDAGRNQWRMKEEARLADVKAGISDAKEEVGNGDAIDLQNSKAKQKGFVDSAVDMRWSGRSMREVIESFFGKDSKTAKRFVRPLRKAFQARTAEMIRLEKAWGGQIEKATGKTGRPARLQVFKMQTDQTIKLMVKPEFTETIKVPIATFFDAEKQSSLGLSKIEIAQLTEQFEGLPEKSNVKYLTLKRALTGEKYNGRMMGMTEAEGIHISMLWAQEGYKKGMTKHGYGEDFQQELETELSPSAKALRDFLADYYRDSFPDTAKLYREMFGVNLRQIENYAPGTFWFTGAEDTSIDPSAGIVSGGSFKQGMGSGGSFSQGSHKQRTSHTAAPKLRNAFDVFFSHANQSIHWKHLAGISRELNGVFGNPDLKVAMEARNPEAAAALRDFMRVIENNGVQLKAPGKFIQFLLEGQAYMAMAYKASTAIKNALGGALNQAYAIPPTEFIRGLGRLAAGKLELSPILNSEIIQNKLNGGNSPELRAAISKSLRAKPTMRGDFLLAGMEIHATADAYGNVVGAAIAYDYHLRQTKEQNPNMSEGQAMAIAWDMTEDSINRLSQPSEVIDRSLAELNSNWLGKLMFLYRSEQRQKSSLYITAMENVVTGKMTAEDFRVIFITHLVMAPIMKAVSATLSDAMDPDDDEWFDDKNWNPYDFLIAAATGPLSGIMLLGDVFSSFTGTNSPLANYAKAGKSAVDIFTDKPKGDKLEWYSSKINNVLHGVGAFPGVAANIAKQVVGVTRNLTSD